MMIRASVFQYYDTVTLVAAEKDILYATTGSGGQSEINISGNLDTSGSTKAGSDLSHTHQVTGSLQLTGALNLDISGSLVDGYVLTTDTAGNASWRPNTTSSFATFAAEAGKVSNALTASYGISSFTYDGSSTAHVGVDTSLIATLTGSQTLEDKIITGSFTGSFTGSYTGSFAGDGSGLTGVTAAETDTLDDVTTRGNTTANSITVGSFLSNGDSVISGNLVHNCTLLLRESSILK